MIIIFDNDRESAEMLRDMLVKECGYSAKGVSIYEGSARQLVEAVKNDEFRTIGTLFIDLTLKSGNHGIDLAAKIHEINDTIHIVFTSSYGKLFIQQIFLDYYDFVPCSYLIKPVNLYFLKKTVEKIKYMDSARERIWIKTQWTTVGLDAQDIIYIGTGDHSTVFYTKNNEYRSYTLFEKIVPTLPSGFVRCHKSFAVNSVYVVSRTATAMTLKDNKVIPISRTYKESVKEFFENGRSTDYSPVT